MPRLYHLNAHTHLRKYLRNHSTSPERMLWQYLRRRQFHDLKFRRQEGIGRYIVDFYCPEKRLAIEIDGTSHNSSQQQAYDRERTEYLNACYIWVVRFSNNDVIENIQLVLCKLERMLFPTP